MIAAYVKCRIEQASDRRPRHGDGMKIDLTDKVIAITGGARGFGRALALGLAREGAHIAVLARTLADARRTADEIAAASGTAAAFAADVTDEAEVRAAAAAVDARFGRLDALIGNAGWMPPRTPVLELDYERLRRALDSNLTSQFLVTKHLAPLIVRSGGGRIIYMSSIGATHSAAGGAPYAAAKAGLNMLAQVVHRELQDRGVRTVAIAPGLTVTPGMEAIMTPEHLARVAASYPNGRVGQPEDIVGLVTFLCASDAEHLSGTVITVRPLT
jgi:NAD(P)-dependent dehydrogenase (short-subunit alcohol dehydrogenase family)